MLPKKEIERNEGQVIIDNHQVELDLNFYDGVPEYDWTTEYENYVANLKRYKADVKEYVDFHLEKVDSSIIDKILAETDMPKSRKKGCCLP